MCVCHGWRRSGIGVVPLATRKPKSRLASCVNAPLCTGEYPNAPDSRPRVGNAQMGQSTPDLARSTSKARSSRSMVYNLNASLVPTIFT